MVTLAAASARLQDQDRQRLRELLLAGATSGPAEAVDQGYFESLRKRLRATRG